MTVPIEIKVPEILLKWLRFKERIPFTRPLTFLILGMRGSGKSSLLEVLAIRYPKIIDLFGSSDNEGLCWCKPKFTEVFKLIHGREPRILLVTSETKETASKFDTKKISELKLATLEDYDVITTANILYSTEDEYFSALHDIIQLLWQKRTHWKEPWFVLIREASNWIYARMKLAKNDMMAKSQFVKSLREARHHGLAVGVDTLRWTSLDKEVRDVSDYIFLKRAGAIGLPDDLRWMYRYIRPYSMMQAKPQNFMLTTSKGSVGYGTFAYPCWHKEEKENILRSTGIEVKSSNKELPDNLRYGVGDFEHVEIIDKYMQLKSMAKTAKALGRAPGTVHNHIRRHNSSVNRLGKCKKCFNANSKYSQERISVARQKPFNQYKV